MVTAVIDLTNLTLLPPGRRFLHGLGLPLHGLRVIARHRALWPYVIVPVLVTAALLGGAAWVTYAYGAEVTAALISRPSGSGWLAGAGRVLWTATAVLVHLAIFGVLAVLGWFVSGLLASPSYDLLSERIERMALGASTTAPGSMARDVAIGVAHSLGALALWLACACPLLLLHLVPVAGEPLYLVAHVGLSSMFMAREVLDFSFSRRRYGFRQKLDIVWAHRGVTAGLGLGTFAMLWVPLLNLLSLPGAVVGGTLLCCELERDRLIPPAPR